MRVRMRIVLEVDILVLPYTMNTMIHQCNKKFRSIKEVTTWMTYNTGLLSTEWKAQWVWGDSMLPSNIVVTFSNPRQAIAVLKEMIHCGYFVDDHTSPTDGPIAITCL